MALFGKKKEKPICACSCGCAETQPAPTEGACCPEAVGNICCAKVLGAGCKACHDQLEQAKTAVKNLGLSVEVEYVTDMEKIMNYGVMSMPAIVINEKVASGGKILKAADVEVLLKKFGG